MVLIIASMLVMQVFADIAVKWYTAEGFASLAASYAQSSNAPHWYTTALLAASEHARVLVYLYAAFEVSVACLLAL